MLPNSSLKTSFHGHFKSSPVRTATALLLTSVLFAGCGGGGDDPVAVQPAAVPEASTDVQLQALSATQLKQQISQKFTQGVQAAGFSNARLMIFKPDGSLLYEHVIGTFNSNAVVPVASASKLASGLAIMRLVNMGTLSLESKPYDVLSGWPLNKKDITLRHLLSFTSGMPGEHLCTTKANITLATCVDTLKNIEPKFAPGTAFDYGSTHLAVAGRMAEVATNKSWNTLFKDVMITPLEITSATYYAQPVDSLNPDNPLVAGGMRISMNDYAKLLRLVMGKGQFKKTTTTQTLISKALVETMATDHYPGAIIANSPTTGTSYGSYRYGLTQWLECSTPSSPGCANVGVSSPGAYGFVPWVSWKDGYFAIIGTQQPAGAWADGIEIQQSLKDLIAQLVAASSGSTPPPPR